MLLALLFGLDLGLGFAGSFGWVVGGGGGGGLSGLVGGVAGGLLKGNCGSKSWGRAMTWKGWKLLPAGRFRF